MDYRIEKDTMGEIRVRADKYWGAQTQRSLENFKIGSEKMPLALIRALAYIKKAAATTNNKLGLLDNERTGLICQVADDIVGGRYDDQFPLVVWQTGSGTQSNMNINELISNRSKEICPSIQVHANDHVNKSQSSNDVFPSAMRIAIVMEVKRSLIPAINQMEKTMEELSIKYMPLIKTGRTHLQDATPISLGQEISGWQAMLRKSKKLIKANLKEIRVLGLGGTAVGTGLNSHKDFGHMAVSEISTLTGYKFKSADNKFHSLTSLDDIVSTHGAVKALACDLMKIANDIRWLSSGPRTGIGELIIPANEPGSSIMPGKVNPTQAEALTMVVCQVIGNDTTIGIAGSQGNFQLNTFLPVTIYNFLQSVDLLSQAIVSFNKNCLQGLRANVDKIKVNLENSLMLVTALTSKIGYDKAAQIAKKAYEKDISLKEAILSEGILTEKDFDYYMDPKKMIKPNLG